MKAKVFPATRLYDAAPVLGDLAFYRTSMLDNTRSNTLFDKATDRHIERLEDLLIHALGWRGWDAADAGEMENLFQREWRGDPFVFSNFSGFRKAMLNDLDGFLGWLLQFPKIPKVMRARLEAVARKLKSLRKRLIAVETLADAEPIPADSKRRIELLQRLLGGLNK